MKIYLVGGAVRDQLMGLPVKDRDWVVVGATPEQMLDAGYRPVGADFPVFLHPETSEEYALARTERKTGMGYKGFTFHADGAVTLEQDLSRRDLTINAMATDGRSLVDPHGGERDLRDRIFRHVGPAFREDPVRILRIARMSARHPEFRVAPETLELMREMVQAGEVDALVAERVWKEVSRGLMEDKPSRMFEVLRECGALQRLMPELDRLWGVPQTAVHHPEIDTGIHVMMVIDHSASIGAPLSVRYACLVHDLGKGTTYPDLLPRHIGHEGRSAELARSLAERLRIPTELSDLADLVAREHTNIHASMGLNGAAVGRLIQRCGAIRKPTRFEQALVACECDARGRLGFENREYPQADRLRAALASALAVDTKAVVRACQEAGVAGVKIGEAIERAQLGAIRGDPYKGPSPKRVGTRPS